ncbi:MAG: methyltransferase domain-containing protein [bacterium]
MRPPDLEKLRDDLLHFRAELEEPGVRQELIQTALPRLLATLEMVPDAAASGDVLELGSSPYFLSLCLRRLCRGRIAHGNYFGSDTRSGADRLVHGRSGETIEFQYEHFNIETDDFPYPDASFDVVVFSELIEHLGCNPVRTLSEIHRVLRPGGSVVVTTPNALSLERFATFVRGGSQMVDRYSPLFGYGARHNREYNPDELRTLLEACGFSIEAMTLRDLVEHPPRERWQRTLWRKLLKLHSPMRREEHIFLRARRGERFRWGFPPGLFDNIQFYTLVRAPWFEMGINDTIQTAAGWHPLEPRQGADGAQRWIRDMGQGFLKTPAEARGAALDVFAAAAPGAPPAELHVIVWDRWLGRVRPENVYVDNTITIERGRWRRIELPLGAQRAIPGDEVEVRLTPGAAPPELNALPEWQRSVAVHRVEYV